MPVVPFMTLMPLMTTLMTPIAAAAVPSMGLSDNDRMNRVADHGRLCLTGTCPIAVTFTCATTCATMSATTSAAGERAFRGSNESASREDQRCY
jgi:hypothetical protein